MHEPRLKAIPNYPNYFAHVNGKIYSAKGKEVKELKVRPNNAGYLRVDMINDEGYKDTVYVQRVIAETFYSYQRIAFPERTQVNHKNKKKLDNRAKNLEWVTPRENAIHSARSK